MNHNRGKGIATKIFDFGGLLVAEGIGSEGEALYVALGDDDGPHGCACARCAPHEQLGPLPEDWREWVDLGPVDRRVSRALAQVEDDRRCTATRRDGKRCNGHATRGRTVCPAHARQEAQR